MLVCEGETVGKIGEVDANGGRELVLVVNVRCEQGMRHDNCFRDTKMCNP